MQAVLAHEAGTERMEAQSLLSFGGPAYRLAARILGSEEGVDDALQQAYLQALQEIGAGRPPAEPRTWFLTVVANCARKHLRSEARRRRREAAVGQESAARQEPGPDAALVAELRRAMGMLEERYRTPVALCCEEGLTQREAAQILGLPERTVSKHVSVGLERLRRALARAGYAAAPAAVLGALAHTAPPVPSALVAALEKLVQEFGAASGTGPGAAQAGAHAAAAAKGGLAVKVIAGVVLAGVVAGAGVFASGLLDRDGAGRTGAPGGSERLLFGFEREECQRAAAAFGTKNALRPRGSGVFTLMPPQASQTGGALGGISPMEMVRAGATQGDYALKVPNAEHLAETGEAYLYSTPPLEDLGLAGDPRVNLRLPELFNTGGWFAQTFPSDWSAWDVLRLDVRAVHERPVTILVEVEDEDVEPPVSRTYAGIEPGSWVTLELDLREAARERGLDLGRMCNLFVRFDSREELAALGGRRRVRNQSDLERTEVYLDNIRLCRKDSVCALPAIRGERSPYTLELPRSYAAEIAWHGNSPARGGRGVTIAGAPALPAASTQAAAEGLRPSAPGIVDLPPLLGKGFLADTREGVTPENLSEFVVLKAVTAADDEAMLVSFGLPALGYEMRFDKPAGFGSAACPMAAVATADGGRTWGGFAGPGEVPSFLHKGRGGWEGSAFDAGPDLMGLHDDGCLTFRNAYEWYPADRTFLWRTVFSGGAWRMSPLLFVSGDLRWCSHASQSVLQLPSGRLWCAWNGRGRRGEQAWAKYSDDGGATWHGWRGDGRVSTVPLRGQLFPYGGHVGMIAEKGRWTLYDGQAWVEPPPTPVFDPVQVVASGPDVYVVDRKGPLAWYDGAAWRSLDLPGREDYPRFYRRHGNGPGDPEWVAQQHFSVCGDTVLFTEPDRTGKKLLCWRRPKGGAWAGPEELVSEETPIADVAAPRYGLAGFAPVAYNCWGDDERRITPAEKGRRPAGRDLKPWIKVLRVPALGR